MNQRPSIRVR